MGQTTSGSRGGSSSLTPSLFEQRNKLAHFPVMSVVGIVCIRRAASHVVQYKIHCQTVLLFLKYKLAISSKCACHPKRHLEQFLIQFIRDPSVHITLSNFSNGAHLFGYLRDPPLPQSIFYPTPCHALAHSPCVPSAPPYCCFLPRPTLGMVP